MKRLQLEGGTWIVGRPDGAWVWHPAERVVNVALGDGRVRLTADGAPEEILADLAIVPERGPGKPARGQHEEQTTAGKPTGRPGRSDDAKRWARLNAFEDHIAPHLATAEQSVWHHIFRHCRDGTTKSSVRDIAANRGMDSKTASKALAHLIAVGLVWYVFKSSHKGDRSVFGMHLHPEECRTACLEADAPRRARQKQRRPPPVRDRQSRSSTKPKPC